MAPVPETTKKRPRRKSQSVLERQCALWNQEHAVGTAVDVRRADESITRTVTRSEAFVCESGFPVIYLVGIAGYYSLDFCKLVQ